MARRSLVALFGAGVALAAFAGGASAAAERMVDVGSHELRLREEGRGTPVVVLDAGLADGLEKLRPLQERLASVTRVVAYDRAGYGQSGPGPLPRDSGREAEELMALLREASIPEPYVLVGHSLGALNVQLFARKDPKAVAGLVLLDPPPLSFITGQQYPDLREMAERMTAEWQAAAEASAASADVQEKAKAAFFRAIASEHREMFGRTAQLVSAIPTFGDMPLVVIASGKPNPAFGEAAERFQRTWIEQSRALAAKSSRGKFVLAEGSSHYLYLDAPELVSESVLSVVRGVRDAVADAAGLEPPVTTPSGLIYRIVKRGAGPAAKPGQRVVVHETVTLEDGTVVFSTRAKERPITFLLGAKQAIDGVDEGVTGMQVGERRRLVVPPALSRRTNYPDGLSPDATLHYDVELVGIDPE